MSDKPISRILQQQPPRRSDPKQQQEGSSEMQPQASGETGEKQIGEGSYEATRDYQKNVDDYMRKADVASDANAAKPRSEQEARELDEAEREGRSHSKGER